MTWEVLITECAKPDLFSNCKVAFLRYSGFTLRASLLSSLAIKWSDSSWRLPIKIHCLHRTSSSRGCLFLILRCPRMKQLCFLLCYTGHERMKKRSVWCSAAGFEGEVRWSKCQRWRQGHRRYRYSFHELVMNLQVVHDRGFLDWLIMFFKLCSSWFWEINDALGSFTVCVEVFSKLFDLDFP